MLVIWSPSPNGSPTPGALLHCPHDAVAPGSDPPHNGWGKWNMHHFICFIPRELDFFTSLLDFIFHSYLILALLWCVFLAAESAFGPVLSDRHKSGTPAMGCSSGSSSSRIKRLIPLPTLWSGGPRFERPEWQGQVSCHGGANWHLELLAMSTDLKRKLRDPEFVATRCDLDGLGDLNPHELKQAARVYGISAGDPRLQGLQVIRQRMGKKGFAKLVAPNPEASCTLDSRNISESAEVFVASLI